MLDEKETSLHTLSFIRVFVHLLLGPQDALLDRWSVINLLDMLKETDLRIGVTSEFHTSTAREHLDRTTLQKRLLLCF